MMIKKGSSRWVVCFMWFAVKFPAPYSYKSVLRGLISNINEYEFWKYSHTDKVCPILFHVWGGALNVMPLVKKITPEDFLKLNHREFCDLGGGSIIPAEYKEDTFGYYRGNIVALDYD